MSVNIETTQRIVCLWSNHYTTNQRDHRVQKGMQPTYYEGYSYISFLSARIVKAVFKLPIKFAG